MKTRDPLTLPDLRRIAQARRDDPDVRALLWEIKRLHLTLGITEDLRQSIERAWGDKVGGHLFALAQLRNLLIDEPAVAEKKARRES